MLNATEFHFFFKWLEGLQLGTVFILIIIIYIDHSGHGHGSESPHTSSVYRSRMRCILKTGQVFKIRGGIPISAARASVGGVWPRAKYGSAALYAGRSLVVQVLWHLQLTYR